MAMQRGSTSAPAYNGRWVRPSEGRIESL